jgi:hypothetical protein
VFTTKDSRVAELEQKNESIKPNDEVVLLVTTQKTAFQKCYDLTSYRMDFVFCFVVFYYLLKMNYSSSAKAYLENSTFSVINADCNKQSVNRKSLVTKISESLRKCCEK